MKDSKNSIKDHNIEQTKYPPLFIDQPQIGEMILDYPNYVKSISNFILNSHPQFTIGIFGDWGTGKTTILLNIQNELEKQGCNCVSFNPWRYENETAQITIPLILSIVVKMYELMEKNSKNLLREQPENNKDKTLKEKIQRIFSGLSLNTSFGIPGLAGLDIEYDFSRQNNIENNIGDNDFSNTTLEKTKIQEGIDLIHELITKSKGVKQNSKLKLIVLIDDLDRCSPEKAVKIFESIKVFFDMEGIVFILGLSNEIVELAINEKYKHFGDKFSGEDYLKKIIQLPIKIPRWESDDIETYLKDSLLKNYKDDELREIFHSNSKLISEAVEPNPREIKRFLNSYILTRQILMSEKTKNKEKNDEAKKLLAIQALRLRWSWLYETIFDKMFRTNLKKLLQSSNNSKSSRSKKGSALELVFQDTNLTNFLRNTGRIIFSINDKEWKEYRRAGSIEHEIETNIPISYKGISFDAQQKIIGPKIKPIQSAQIGSGGPFTKGQSLIEQANVMSSTLKQYRLLKAKEKSIQLKKYYEDEIQKKESELKNFLYGFSGDFIKSFLDK